MELCYAVGLKTSKKHMVPYVKQVHYHIDPLCLLTFVPDSTQIYAKIYSSKFNTIFICSCTYIVIYCMIVFLQLSAWLIAIRYDPKTFINPCYKYTYINKYVNSSKICTKQLTFTTIIALSKIHLQYGYQREINFNVL